MIAACQAPDIWNCLSPSRRSRLSSTACYTCLAPSSGSLCTSSFANQALDTVAPAQSNPCSRKSEEDARPSLPPPRQRNSSRRKKQHVAATVVGEPKALVAGQDGSFRFWVEEQVIKNPTSVQLVQGVLEECQGVRSGGPPKSAGHVHTYGFMAMDRWDLLWTVTNKALKAAELGLRPGQAMCVIPGMSHISRKSALPASLLRLLSAGAWDITPRSFNIPSEMHAWRTWAAAQPDGCRGQLWMLKNNQQRGVGLKLVTTEQALAASQELWLKRDSTKETFRWLLLQRYISDPMLVDGRKFGIRAWVLVTDVLPMRAYLHGCGLVLFSSHTYTPDRVEGEAGAIAPGHVTNYAQNQDGTVWSLAQLQDHMGQEAYSKVWRQVSRAATAVCRACEPGVEESMAKLNVPPHSCFQTLGLDFVLDASGKAWLLEVNATPSMAVVHSDPGLKQLILEQKKAFLRDTVNIAGIPDRFLGTWPMHDEARIVNLEQQRRGQFVRLPLEDIPLPDPVL